MCSHYQAVTALDRFERQFQTRPPAGDARADMWPAYPAAIVLDKLGHRHSVLARWGLIPASTRAPNQKLSTFNARSESMATSPTFRGAWAKGQRCIVPAEAIYEPDWRSGRHVPTRLQGTDGNPLGIAGLWDEWVSPEGEVTMSFTMLTINADKHPIMKHMHKPHDEKRMVVVLQAQRYDLWLHAGQDAATPADAGMTQLLDAVQKMTVPLTATGEPDQATLDNPPLF